MPLPSSKATSRAKVEEHRLRLRRQGLRPVQLWVPDTRTAAFLAEAQRQAALVAASEHARQDQDFVDAITHDDA